MWGLFTTTTQPTMEHLKRLTFFLLIQETSAQNDTNQPIESHHFGSCGITCSAVLTFLAFAAIGMMSHELCRKIRAQRQAPREIDYLMGGREAVI